MEGCYESITTSDCDKPIAAQCTEQISRSFAVEVDESEFLVLGPKSTTPQTNSVHGHPCSAAPVITHQFCQCDGLSIVIILTTKFMTEASRNSSAERWEKM